jgi:hypothetical protein
VASISSSLAPLALLACPVGMGVMMWVMSKGMRGRRAAPSHDDQGEPSLADLRAEHRRLGAEIERLERTGRPEPEVRVRAGS